MHRDEEHAGDRPRPSFAVQEQRYEEKLEVERSQGNPVVRINSRPAENEKEKKGILKQTSRFEFKPAERVEVEKPIEANLEARKSQKTANTDRFQVDFKAEGGENETRQAR